MKANRHLALHWQLPKTSSINSIPVSYRWSESIFGEKLIDEEQHNITIDLANNLFSMSVPSPLTKKLSQVNDSLNPQDAPMVVRVWGSWGYLDRGRGYGLQIGDRLIHKRNDKIIKGHIVGFYGPGLQMQSPRGFSVPEGAILFIRKHQKLLKIGQQFIYDSTSFPTKWPPVSTPEE